MTNVNSAATSLHTELSKILELLAKTAISEIIKLFDVRYSELRLEVLRKGDENADLKRRVNCMQDELASVRMRFGIGNGVQDGGCYSRAQESGGVHTLNSPLQQSTSTSSRESSCRMQIKEERHSDMHWRTHTGCERADTSDCLQITQSQEPGEFRQLLLNLKEEQEQQEEDDEEEDDLEQRGGGGGEQHLMIRSDGHTQEWSEATPWSHFSQSDDINNDEEEDFLPLLPRIEQAIGYFHSNPISPLPEKQGGSQQTDSNPAGGPQQEAHAAGPGATVEHLGAYSGSDATSTSAVHQIRRTGGRQPSSCPVCYKQLPSEIELLKHMRCHPGKRPYECTICGMHLAQKSSLRTHERLHSGLRPYRCPHCDKDYTLGHHLKRHMRTHFRDNAKHNANSANANSNANQSHTHQHTHGNASANANQSHTHQHTHSANSANANSANAATANQSHTHQHTHNTSSTSVNATTPNQSHTHQHTHHTNHNTNDNVTTASTAFAQSHTHQHTHANDNASQPQQTHQHTHATAANTTTFTQSHTHQHANDNATNANQSHTHQHTHANAQSATAASQSHTHAQQHTHASHNAAQSHTHFRDNSSVVTPHTHQNTQLHAHTQQNTTPHPHAHTQQNTTPHPHTHTHLTNLDYHAHTL
ncbi:zinc finger protein 577-like [Engraulis encrasicolus]|uniref:zinc finger protein 577-like n=1 Tax=Engraulis encrasicolus TaxID=184585 RepID=UPI002FD241F0